MADRYWVGGTANWDATAGTKWAATSGGAGGQSVPTSADNVFFDAASGAVTVTVSATPTCQNLNFTGFTGTFAGSVSIFVSGNFTLAASVTWTATGQVAFQASSGSYTVTTAGKTLGAFTLNTAGSTAVYTLQDALTCSGAITVIGGTLTTNNFNVTATQLVSSNSNTRTINLGSSTVALNGSGTQLNFSNTTGLTFNAGTSTITSSGTGSPTFVTGGVTLNNVSFTNTGAGTAAISGAATFNNLSVAAPSTAGVTQVTFDSRTTINGTLSTTGTAGNRRVWFQGSTYGIAQTLTINSAASLTDADFRDIYIIGTAAPISGTRLGDLRGCRGITFSTPKTVYWNLAGTQNWSANAWATTSTGTPSTDNFPLAQDTATFTNAGSVTGPITMDAGAVPYTGTVDMSGRTSAMTLVLGAFSIYGNWITGSGITYSGSSTLTYSGRNTQTITSAGKAFTGPIIIDSYGGTVELVDALNIGTTQTLTVTNGTFDTKNYNVTANSLSSSNSNVRTITLGSSTVTLGGNLDFTTNTNLTFNAGTSTILCTSFIASFVGGSSTTGVTFYDVSFTSTTAGSLGINGLNTFRNLTVSAPASVGISPLLIQADQTITGTLTCAGATAVRRVFLRSAVIGTTRTLTVNSLSATDCDFRDITIAGAAAGSSPTRAGNCGGNTGITFPAPKTVYWNLVGTQNWSATAWASSSGGTPDINQFPLAQDTAVFDNPGSAGTITTNAAWNIGTLNMSGRTSACTIDWSNSGPFYYGNVLLGSGVTPGTTGAPTFAGRGTQTITSNGNTWSGALTIDCFTGTVQLADALTIIAARTLTMTSGTFDAVTYNVTTGLASISPLQPATLKMGSGTWTLSGTGAVWTAFAGSLTFYKGTANIVLSDTSTTGRTFAGGGLSYNKLTIGGTTGTSTTTISGNNQFTELASTKTVAHTIDLGSTTQTFGAWTVSGTVGNVVTLTGTGTSHILAGACTSGIDYLAMGSIGFAAASPGEFYAGANSTGTAAAPVYRTAKPADSTRYWVGGTGNWSDTARWSTSSGGGSGASVPRSHDDVVFNSASNATAYTATVNAVTGGIRCKALTIAGPTSGNLTLAGSTAIDGVHGNVTLPATGLTRTYTGAITLSGSSTGRTLTTNAVALASGITVNGVGCAWSLGAALDIGSSALTITNGTFITASYNLTVGTISSDNENTRSIEFGASTITVSSNISFGSVERIRNSFTVVAGTSQINMTSSLASFFGNGHTYYDLSFTTTFPSASLTLNSGVGALNTFRNLSFSAASVAGVKNILLQGNQTVTGTLTLSAGTNATIRHFLQSDTVGTTRTLTCAAFSGTDADFRDITIAGAAAPVSGTRLGDCKGNSGITFDAPKTVYWRSGTTANWGSSVWSATSGGTADLANFPLPQDTVVFPSSPTPYPTSGNTATINAAYNIGTIDMSARTSNTMTLATSTNTPAIYGNWINGTGTTLTGTGTLTFSGRGSQTITSAGKTFTQAIAINTPGGSVTLQDALNTSLGSSSAFNHVSGTFNANGYNVTISGASGGVASQGSATRTLAISSGTWTLSGTGGWNVSGSNLTVTGTGTISQTSASAKTFAGGGFSYSGVTLNQGGAGTLTITGNNTFANITNTYKATGATTIALGTTTQTVGSFTASGEVFRMLTITGTSASSPATLILTSGTVTTPDYLIITGVRAYSLIDTWYAGGNAINNGSLGWYFFSLGGNVYAAFIGEATSGVDAISSIIAFGRSVSESASGIDAVSALATLGSAVAESASGVDITSLFAPIDSSVSETASGTDVASTIASFGSAVSETASGVETVSAAFLYPRSISETASGIDTVSAISAIVRAVSETASITDSINSSPSVFGSIVSETASGVDTQTAIKLIARSVAETASGFDATAGREVLFPSISEAASGVDTQTATNSFARSVAENASGVETVSAVPRYPRSISETVIVGEGPTTNASLGSAVSETASGADFIVAMPRYPRSVSETASGIDSVASGFGILRDVSETASGVDAQTATNSFARSVAETASGVDGVSTVQFFGSAVSETASGVDEQTAIKIIPRSVAETASGVDEVLSSAVKPVAISETASGVDVVLGSAVTPNAISEAASGVDTQTAIKLIARSVAETASGIDDVTRVVFFGATVAETTRGNDQIVSQVPFAAALAEFASGLDSVSPPGSVFNTSVFEYGAAAVSLRRAKLLAVDLAKYIETGADVYASILEVQLLDRDSTFALIDYNQISAKFLGIHYDNAQVELLDNSRTAALVSYNEIFAEVLSVPTAVKKT